MYPAFGEEGRVRGYVVDLAEATTFEGFVAAFNEGFCRHCGGHWHGRSWDAFHDYLSWPEEQQYRLTFKGWKGCRGLRGQNRRLVREILADNPHVEVVFA
jgi:hypothetical protein